MIPSDAITIDGLIDADQPAVHSTEQIDVISFGIVRTNMVDQIDKTLELETLLKYIHGRARQPRLIFPQLICTHHYYADCVSH